MIKNEPSKAQTANDLLMRGVPRIGFWIYCYWRCFWSPATVCVCRLVAISPTKLRGHFPATRGTPNWQSPGCSCSVLSTCPAVCARSLLVHHLHLVDSQFLYGILWYPVLCPRTLLFEIQSQTEYFGHAKNLPTPFWNPLLLQETLSLFHWLLYQLLQRF